MQIPQDHKVNAKIALGRVMAPLAFWSFEPKEIEKGLPDKVLIEAVLLHGNDPLRKRLLGIFDLSEIKKVWEERLIIQGPRLQILNRKIAKDIFGISDPSEFIRRSYRKHNLYARFSE